MQKLSALSLLLALSALTGCQLLPQGEQPRGRSPGTTASSNPRAQQCLAELGQTGASFSPRPDSYSGGGCALLNTVSLDAMRGDMSNFGVTNLGPVACPTANAFVAWVRYGVDRAARQYLGSPIARIETMGSYACRDVAGTGRRSAHATAEAVDVSAFILADGRRVSVLDDWDGGGTQERAFLRIVQRSACKRFETVLGPEYNAAHRNHFHLERGGDGGFCR